MKKGLIAGALAVTAFGAFYISKEKGKPSIEATALQPANPKSSPNIEASAEVAEHEVAQSEAVLTQPVLEEPKTDADTQVTTSASESAASGSQENITPEQKELNLRDSILKDENLKKIADVNAIQCQESSCNVEFEAKTDEAAGGLQMAVIRFLQAHPEYGSNFKIMDSKENPRLAQFTFSKEKLQ